MRRQRSLLPYQPQPIRPTRLGLPLTMSSPSAPSADRATEADTVWRNRRRLMLKFAADVELKAVDFMWGSMNRALWQCNHYYLHLVANHTLITCAYAWRGNPPGGGSGSGLRRARLSQATSSASSTRSRSSS